MHTIAFKNRDSRTRLASIRSKGDMPAVFYGRLEKSTPIAISSRGFAKLLKQAGESSVISLKGEGEEHQALIQEVQFHPISGAPLHADFYVVEKDKKVEVGVELKFVGESFAVKSLGGILIKVMHELPISALPKDLPGSIEVDISALKDLDSRITVKDLKLPEGVFAEAEGEEVVAAISVAKEEVEAAPVDLSAIEVEKKGKKEEEGDAPAAPEGAAAGAEEKKQSK